MDIEELVAKESIRDLVARYNAYGDSGRFDSLAGLFTEDGVLVFEDAEGGTHCRGRTEIIALMEAFKREFAVLGGDGAEPGRIYHSVTTHIIDLHDECRASGRSYVSMLGPAGLVEWGEYRDEYLRTAGRWHISKRRARRLGRAEVAPSSVAVRRSRVR